MTRWQWHQLDHMQIICISLQTDNHASTSSFNFLQAGCLLFLMPNQQCQSTEGCANNNINVPVPNSIAMNTILSLISIDELFNPSGCKNIIDFFRSTSLYDK